MTTSALDIITGAAKLIGALFKSETLTDDEANDGLIQLNDMLDSWSNDNLLTTAYTKESFPLTGATSYTMGVGGNFNTGRPINIVTATVTVGNIDYPLDIITPEEYETEIAQKFISQPIPWVLVYDNGYPLGTIKMYAVPSAGGTLNMLSNKPLTNISALTITVDLPPGWKRALKSNLAIELAPQYGVEVPQAVIKMAKDSLGAIKIATSVNNAMPYMGNEGRSANIFSGFNV